MKGTPCPVCQRVFEAIPKEALPPALTAATKDPGRSTANPRRRDPPAQPSAVQYRVTKNPVTSTVTKVVL